MTSIEKNFTDITALFDNIRQILIDLGLVTVTADGALALSTAAINPDGTIKTNKVTTTSIIGQGVNKPYFIQNTADVVLPNTVDQTIFTLTTSKDLVESDLQISSLIRMSSSDDLRGDFRLLRNGILIDTVPIFANGSGGSFKLPISLLFRDVDAPQGTNVYAINFLRQGGGSTVTALSASNLEIVEVKR